MSLLYLISDAIAFQLWSFGFKVLPGAFISIIDVFDLYVLLIIIIYIRSLHILPTR